MTYEAWRISYQSSEQAARAAYAECARLQAKVEALERQEPVGKFIQHPSHGMWEQDGYSDNPDAKPLYLAHGAQPAPSIPEGWKLVPTAESRHPGIYKMLGALHTVDNTPGASEWASYAAFLAVAPEAKP